jgi:mono/diheme cytochrome c family protein
MKGLFITTIAATMAVSMSYAGQPNTKVTIPAVKTAPTDGRQMYTNYCAPCHGVDGKGRGPVAPALKNPPSDLTLLSRNNQGRFPDAHVASVLLNGAQIPSHGSSQMPVWGPILANMNVANPQERLLRISNLTSYLESIQAR